MIQKHDGRRRMYYKTKTNYPYADFYRLVCKRKKNLRIFLLFHQFYSNLSTKETKKYDRKKQKITLHNHASSTAPPLPRLTVKFFGYHYDSIVRTQKNRQ